MASSIKSGEHTMTPGRFAGTSYRRRRAHLTHEGEPQLNAYHMAAPVDMPVRVAVVYARENAKRASASRRYWQRSAAAWLGLLVRLNDDAPSVHLPESAFVNARAIETPYPRAFAVSPGVTGCRQSKLHCRRCARTERLAMNTMKLLPGPSFPGCGRLGRTDAMGMTGEPDTA